MSEETVRLLLNDVAGGDAPLTAAEPATLFARARRANRRRAAGAATATVLLILAGAGTVIASQRSDDRHGDGSVASSPSPTLSPSVRPRLPRPSTTASGPFCGWNDQLAPMVMAGLPVKGAWGTPSQVFGICGETAGVRIPVTEAGRTGDVWVVISLSSPDEVRRQACVDGSNGVCEQLPDGYLWWQDSQGSNTLTGSPEFFGNSRLGTDDGVLIDVTCFNHGVDDNGRQLTTPPLDHAACTGEQARALALELVKIDWFQ
ncbi:hypothetical protein ABZS66_06290 [Dactylosporangium sp. NPDC005572]|uniref:hypothetical protein n=1 Tax=Dactylosporangium sp. NPDC005572 TaxID=3156889 RepID=UPI0033BAFC74